MTPPHLSPVSPRWCAQCAALRGRRVSMVAPANLAPNIYPLRCPECGSHLSMEVYVYSHLGRGWVGDAYDAGYTYPKDFLLYCRGEVDQIDMPPALARSIVAFGQASEWVAHGWREQARLALQGVRELEGSGDTRPSTLLWIALCAQRRERYTLWADRAEGVVPVTAGGGLTL